MFRNQPKLANRLVKDSEVKKTNDRIFLDVNYVKMKSRPRKSDG